jgi:hypothetical protein
MPLNTAEIIRRLNAVPSIQKDNEAQNIINGASNTELRNLDAEGVLRLYEALAMLPPRIFSSNDRTALTKLRSNTQFQPVTNNLNLAISLIRSARPSPYLTQLTPGLVTRIYAAEHQRLSLAERIGIDGSTIGRGQLSQAAYTDVINPINFRDAFAEYINRVFIPALLTDEFNHLTHYWNFDNYTPIRQSSYNNVYHNQTLEDFVVAAYLAIRIRAAIKPGRSTMDTVRFAVALYHGMRNMLVTAQNAVNNTIDWAPVEAELRSQGHIGDVDYVNEVVR